MSLKRNKPLQRKTPLKRGKKPLKLSAIKKKFKVVTADQLTPTPKPKRKKRLKYRAKGPTGQKELFIHLFRERGAKSQISGTQLIEIPDGDGPEYEKWWKAFLSQFSHILPKGSYKKMMLVERNIVLKTVDEHELWENHKESLREKPEWKWVFELEEELKREANGVVEKFL